MRWFSLVEANVSKTISVLVEDEDRDGLRRESIKS
jgi:hypothetical protein